MIKIEKTVKITLDDKSILKILKYAIEDDISYHLSVDGNVRFDNIYFDDNHDIIVTGKENNS